MDESGKLIAVIGDEVSWCPKYIDVDAITRAWILTTLISYFLIYTELTSAYFFLDYLAIQDTVTGFVLAGTGHRDAKGSNFLVVKEGKIDFFLSFDFTQLFALWNAFLLYISSVLQCCFNYY